MDKVSTYRAEIKRLLETYASIVARQATRGVETLLALDEADDQFLWLQASWVETCRVQGVTVHVRIVAGRIRIEQDWTEDGIANDLLRAGVPPEDIVLAFHEPVADTIPASLVR